MRSRIGNQLESEQAPPNPYEGMDNEALYEIIREVQAKQREINRQMGMIGLQLTKNYTERLRGWATI